MTPHRAHPRPSPRLLITCLTLSAGLCTGQTENPPPPAGESVDRRPDARLDPLLTDMSADENMRARLTRPAGGVPVRPSSLPVVEQVAPNLTGSPDRLPLADGSAARNEPGTLRPEGTFLVGWTGEIVRLRTGGLAFLPVTKAGSAPEPAMALLPCSTYSQIEGLLGDEERGLWLSLTGEVTVYHDRNWLIPTVFTAAETPEDATESGAETETGAENETDQPSAPETEPAGDDQPEESGDRIEDLIRQLEAQREERRGIDTTFTPPKNDSPPEEESSTGGASLEGRMLLSQRAHMVRTSQGGWVIAIDNDNAASNAGQLPNQIRLLPCNLVEVMERRAETLGESWAFEVSGNLYGYDKTVYLLPRMFVSLPSDDVKPLQ